VTAIAATARACSWCSGPLAAGARRDAVTCSQRCRQARARFNVAVGRPPFAAALQPPLRLAYADPPYPGMAGYYLEHPDYAGEVDHAELIRRLSIDFDGWALSTSASTLQYVLALCPPGVRVGSWHRGARGGRTAGVANAWEPVVYSAGREHVDLSSTWSTRRLDTLEYTARPRLTDPARVIGAKPATFARWMFDLLGALPQDTLADLYPGSGGIGRAWAAYSSPALAGVDPH
jgi:hypothetical protein